MISIAVARVKARLISLEVIGHRYKEYTFEQFAAKHNAGYYYPKAKSQ